MSEFAAIGQPKPIIDGKAKVTGSARYLPDINLPGTLHARLVPSTYAHANVLGVDGSAALKVPGVAAVLTHEDLPDLAPASRNRLLLARGRVIFVGQPVALVLADSETAAADGADQVVVDYEPLPAAMSFAEAVAGGAPLVWPDGIPKGADDAGEHGAGAGGGGEEEEDDTPSNLAADSTTSRGDLAAGFAEADLILDHTYTTPMVHQSSIETHGVLAQPDPLTGGMNVWTSTQDPFGCRSTVAEVLGVTESIVRVKGAVIGGGFGAKFTVYEPLVVLAAQAVNRPVKLALTRSEEIAATTPAPPLEVKLKLGARKDGTLTALQTDVTMDAGCYPMNLASFVGYQVGNYYPVPNMEIRVREALTFKPSAGAYRAPGAPTAFFVIDTAIDEMAEQLGLDSVEMRIMNAAQEGDLQADGSPWPNQGMRETLEAVRAHPVWQNREKSRAKGRGVGIALGGWMGGQSAAAAICNVNRDGVVQINAGSMDISGVATSFNLIAAEAFGVSPDKVMVLDADTDTSPYSAGSGGSKTLYSNGLAVREAAEDARRQVLALAADEFEADPEDLEIVDGEVRVKGTPTRTIPIGDIAAKGMGFGANHAPVLGQGRTTVTDQSPAFSVQLVEVEVDRETGEVQVLKHVIAQDAGRAINPLTVEGQMVGGAVQGLGWALYEEMAYDEDGQLLSGSWMDYTMPDSMQTAPEMETIIVEVPSDHGPFGARGVGEPPVVPTPAAVANAIAHSTGLRLTDLPMTAPRVLEALRSQNGG
ncbi:MAG: xanthine dehydrogenase family protein molybdopterin-binding subunit [Anaerolineaceae bacterium]|nr:xanthine dehydrogenase family protein molybdopterin-binding subunit [Anaerolineaceae bacterium]